MRLQTLPSTVTQTLCICKSTFVTDMGALVNVLTQENKQTYCVF